MKSLETRLVTLETRAQEGRRAGLVDVLEQVTLPVAAVPGHLRPEDAPDEREFPYDATLLEGIRARFQHRSGPGR